MAIAVDSATGAEAWPRLPLEDWESTYATLHRWMQIVGKTRMALAPMQNHWWNAPLYLSARGLTTSPIPYGDREFEVTRDRSKDKALARLRRLRRPLPPGFTFSREEANER